MMGVKMTDTEQSRSSFVNKTMLLREICSPCIFMLVAVLCYTFRSGIRKSSPHVYNGSANRKIKWLRLTITLFMVYVFTPKFYHELDTSEENVLCSSNHTFSNIFPFEWNSIGALDFEWSPIVAYILAASLMFLENTFVWNITMPLFVLWCSTLTCLLLRPITRGNVNEFDESSRDILHICFVLVQCLLFLFEKPEPKTKSEPLKLVHPKVCANWLSDALLLWSLGVIWTGSKKTLEEKDLPLPLDSDACNTDASKFELCWKAERFKQDAKNGNDCKENEESLDNESQEDSNKDQRISLLHVLVQTFGVKFFTIHLVLGIFQLSHFVGPLLLRQFAVYVRNRDNEHWTNGLGIVVTLFAFNSFKTILNHRLTSASVQFQKRVRFTLMYAVVKKSVTIKNECVSDLTTGEIINMVSHDCDRITSMGIRSYLLLSCPLSVMMALYLLYVQVGPAIYFAVLLFVIFMPLNKRIGRKLRVLHKTFTLVRDLRTKIMNEVVNGIKVLKSYGWEPSFIKKLHDIRKKDEEINASLSFVDAGASSMFNAIPFLVKLTVFGVYLLMGGNIDAANAFASMHLIFMMNEPISVLSVHLPTFVEAFTSLKKIENFLNGEDIPEDIVTRRLTGESAVVIGNGMFAWERNGKDTTNLKNVNIRIPKGGLVAVLGVVGAGKSSLLSAILGEMEKLEGSVKVQGRIAYVPQEAWILNASVRDNVVFSSQLETRKYRQVVNACALREDINKMAAGDQTEIGEKGINLSGGQKQRVSLARAVYCDADVYLLDDPLSAVDARVGKHIFENVIGHKGLLKDKTRVLVTHGIQYLPFVDSIIVLKDGEISETGSFEELTSYNGDFAQFARQALSDTDAESSICNNVVHQIVMRQNSLNDEQILSPSIQCNEETPYLNELPNEDFLNESNTNNEDNVLNVNDRNKDENHDVKERSETSSLSTAFRKQGIYTEEENVEKGRVKLEIYFEYLRAIGFKRVALFCILHCCSLLFQFINKYIVKQWTDDPLLSDTSLSYTEKQDRIKWQYYAMFAVTGLFQVVLAFVYVVIITRGAFRAATLLHDKLLYKVLRCPLSFFNTTPSSTIVSRFSKDLPKVDGLGFLLRHTISRFSALCINLILITLYCPLICTALIPVFFAQLIVYLLHTGSLRQLKRLKSKYRSPMYTHFSEMLDGRSSIRAYCAQEKFLRAFQDKVNTYNNIDQWENWVGAGLNMRLILQCHIVEMITCLICIMDTSMTAGMVGMITLYASLFCNATSNFLKSIMEVEIEIVSLERVIDYTKKPSEAPWEVEGEMTPGNSHNKKEWPTEGEVIFRDYQARHQTNSELALKGINCRFESGERIGIVGRTGAGKSSLAMALFRLFEASSGSILIDRKNIAELGLHRLRRSINVLPQEPVIFKGSLRMNLDPFGESSDEELWQVLNHAHLASFVQKLPDTLDYECGEGGKNLSMGQRQLLCLARTLMRKTKILVLDEATAAVDMDTDELIQKTIATEFKNCTVLTIAHRLNTVMDYDKILVLDQGLVKEFDSPPVLLKDKSSVFYIMAKDAKLVQ